MAAGATELDGLVEVETLGAEACRLSALDGALDRLAQAAPRLRERLLRAAVAVVGADRRVVAAEAELLRAIADGLDCPVPPFLDLPPRPLGVTPAGSRLARADLLLLSSPSSRGRSSSATSARSGRWRGSTSREPGGARGDGARGLAERGFDVAGTGPTRR